MKSEDIVGMLNGLESFPPPNSWAHEFRRMEWCAAKQAYLPKAYIFRLVNRATARKMIRNRSPSFPKMMEATGKWTAKS